MNPKRLTPDQGEKISSHHALVEVEFENLSLAQIEEIFILYIFLSIIFMLLFMAEIIYKLHDNNKITSKQYNLPNQLLKLGHQWIYRYLPKCVETEIFDLNIVIMKDNL